MGFRSVEEVRESMYANKFVLQNDKDYADVVLLYKSHKDVLVADTHYIKSDEYSGYVHCLGNGCPACAKGIRKQTKVFVPMYVLNVNGREVNELQFWDRTMKFEPQLNAQVFNHVANPSEYVCRITRVGAYRDINTTYQLSLYKGIPDLSYEKILETCKTSFPDGYSAICKEADAATVNSWLMAANSENAIPAYTATPRVTAPAPSNPSSNLNGVDVLADPATEELDDFVDVDFN